MTPEQHEHWDFMVRTGRINQEYGRPLDLHTKLMIAADADLATLTRERDEAVARQKLAEQALAVEMRGRTSLVQTIHDAYRAKQPWLTSSEMIELVAAWDHQAWASWTAWMLDRLTPENITRWRRQIATPYANLSEGEKESDRREAREVLTIILNALAPNECAGASATEEKADG